MRKIIILVVFLFLRGSLALADQKIQNLGTVGYTCSINKNFSISLKKPSIHLENNLSFNLKKTIPSKNREKSFYNKNLRKLGEKKIYIFGAMDNASILLADDQDVDFGLCVDYDSLDDVVRFKERSEFSQPIILGTKQLVELLQIKTFPVVVHISNGNVQYQGLRQ